MWSLTKDPFGINKKKQRIFSVYLISQLTNRLEQVSSENEAYSKKAAQLLADAYKYYILNSFGSLAVINPVFNPFGCEEYDDGVHAPILILPNNDRLIFFPQTQEADVLQDKRRINLLVLSAPNQLDLSALVHNFNQSYRGNPLFSQKIIGNIDEHLLHFLCPLDTIDITQLCIKKLCLDIQSKLSLL